MSTPKWTPGEWKFGIRRDGSIWLSLGDPVNGPHYQGDLCASENDAHLIAAAPELYAALELQSTVLMDLYREAIADRPDRIKIVDIVNRVLSSGSGRPVSAALAKARSEA